jgi:proline dehydrogenase
MGLLHRAVTGIIPFVPTPVMRRMSARYIAGETPEEAFAELEKRAAQGYPGTLDILGEGVSDEAHSRAVAETYCEAATAIAERGLDTYVSIKPTHFGLTVSEELCLELYDKVCAHANPLGVFVRVEMEDHPTTDATLRVYETLRTRHPLVGTVLQSRLLRTLDDIEAFAPGPVDVRMVKGIYLEPPSIAHVTADPIRDAFVVGTRKLFERGATVRLATHDAPMAERLFELIRELEVPKERYEMQVLLGVQEPLWEKWRDAGHTVRVYVPFGPEWRAYSQRRLKKNPELLGHVMRAALLRR